MAKVTSIKDLAAMIDALETPAMTMNDDLVVNADPMVKIYEETLPVIKVNDTDYRLTLKDADAVRQHDANFLEVYGKVASGLIVEKAKADSEMAAMDITTEIGNASFSTVFSRPTGDTISQKEWAASIGFGYGVPKSKALEGKLRKQFAADMMASDDEDDE
ncbi:hypothetical protein A7C00_000082 [Shigella flexneri]|nr:hypothetical protein [Shigella flexneri]